MQRTQDLNNRQTYYQLRGVAEHRIKDAEKQYWRDYCSMLDSTSKMSQVWSTVKKMSGTGSRPPIPAIVDGGVVYSSNQEKAKLFARKFAAVSSDENLPASFLARCREFERIQDFSTEQQSASVVDNTHARHHLVNAIISTHPSKYTSYQTHCGNVKANRHLETTASPTFY